MVEVLTQAFYGAMGSLALSLSFYFKQLNGEKWSWVKFSKSTLLGAGTGFVAALYGISGEAILVSPLYAGIALTLENLLKAIFRSESKLRVGSIKAKDHLVGLVARKHKKGKK